MDRQDCNPTPEDPPHLPGENIRLLTESFYINLGSIPLLQISLQTHVSLLIDLINVVSRAVSRVDLSAAVACSSSSSGSNVNLSAVGRSSAFSGSNWRLTAGSAPNTPRPTPPVSPQRWPRRFSNRQTPQLPIPSESHPSSMT